MGKYDFTKQIEKMINPSDIGTLQFMQSFSGLLPRKLQNKIMDKGSKDYPYMGFVVEPYSLFLCYELKDLKWAETLIPDGFELVKTKIFSEDTPKYYSIFGCFNVHTSTFWGSRMEFNIIAKNKETGLVTWVIVDYDTNTMSFDRANGLGNSNTSTFINTIDFDGNVIVDIKNKKNHRELVFDSNVTDGKMMHLDQKLWLEGNFSVAHGREISLNSSETFSMKFNPKEVEKALQISKEELRVDVNTWFPGLFHDVPEQVVCFPYAQHYLSDSPGYFSDIRDVNEMKKQVENLDFDDIPIYDTKPLKKLMLIGSALSFTITLMLLILVFFK